MSKRDIRLWFLPEELNLLHALLLNHVYHSIANQDLEPWEAKLLAKVGKSCNKCATSLPGEGQK